MKNLSHNWTSAVLALACMIVAGLPGSAQSMAYDSYDTDERILTDAELHQEIVGDLSMSPFVDAKRLRVSVANGIVTLSGAVEDRRAMVDAVETAYDAGAWRVRNHLRPLDSEAPWFAMRDSELKDAIENELNLSPFVNAGRISISVDNGVATLSGRVENKGEITDAVENAYEAGAKRVRSRLWVDSTHP